MVSLHVDDTVAVFSGSDILFILANAAIVLGYTFIALRVTPLLPIHRLSRIGAFSFFLLCAGTHTDQILHTIFTQEDTWRQIVNEWHMLFIHVPQAFAVWVFAIGFFIDLGRLRQERGTSSPAGTDPHEVPR